MSLKYFLQGPLILFSGGIVAHNFNNASSCVSFKFCGNDSLYNQCNTGTKVSLVKLNKTETDVRGDDGVSGTSIDKFKNGNGLLRTRNGDVGFLKIICDDDNRSLCLCSLFLLIIC